MEFGDRTIENKWYGVLCLVAVLLGTAGMWGAKEAGSRTDMRMRRELVRQAVLVASAIPTEEAQELSFALEDLKKPEYHRLCNYLKAYSELVGLKSIYTIALRDDGTLVFGPESLDPESPGDIYLQPSEKDFFPFRNAEPVVMGPFTDEYGSFVSALAPVIHPRTGEVLMTVGIDIDTADWNARVRKAQWGPLLLVIILLAMLFVGGVLMKRRGVTSSNTSCPLRHTETAICAIISLLLTLGITLFFADQERLQRVGTFYSAARLKAEVYSKGFQALAETLSMLADFFESSEYITAEEFSTVCDPIIQDHAVEGCVWIPEIVASERDVFEAQIQSNGHSGFSIRPLPGAVAEDTFNRFYPALYIESEENTEDALGYDLASEPVRRTALINTLRSGRITATDPIRLEALPDNPGGVFIFCPVNAPSQKGVLALALRPDEMIKSLSDYTHSDTAGMRICLLQLDSGNPPQTLSCPDGNTFGDCSPGTPRQFRMAFPLFAFGKAYAFCITPNEKWLAANRPYLAHIAMGAGLVLSGLLTVLIAILCNRPRRLEQQVRARTAALRESYERFDSLAEQSRTFTWEVDAKGVYTYVSETVSAVLGYDPSELIGNVHFYTLHPETGREQMRADAFKVFACKKSFSNIEKMVETKTGELIWVSTTGQPILNNNGDLIGYRGSDIEITQRKLAEEHLREKETRLAVATQAAGIGIWDLDFVNDVLIWDEHMFELYGVKPENFGGAYEAWQAGVHPDDLERAVAEVAAAERGDEAFDTEFRIIRPDGEVRYIKAFAEVLRDEAGNALRMIGGNYDITERRLAERRLKNSEQEFRSVVEDLQVGVVVHDANSEIVLTNPLARKIFRMDTETMLGRTVDDPVWYFIDEGRRRLEIEDYPVSRVIATHERLVDFVLGIVHIDQDVIWVNVSAIPVFDSSGCLSRVLVNFSDITKRKWAEEALRESEERYRSLHNASFGGIAIHDQGQVLECNRGMSEMTGYSLEELIGMDGLKLIAPASRDLVMKHIQAGFEKPYEATGLRKNGDTYPLRLEARNIVYKGKQVRTVEFRDITEQKQAEQALRESQEYLEAMWNAMDVGIMLVDAQTHEILRINPALLQISGQTEEYLLGKRCHKLVCPAEEHACPVGDLGLVVDRSERILIHKDGHEVQVEKSVTPITLEGRRVYVETLVDITERKRAEAKLWRLSTAIEQSPESVVITDPDGIIQYVNPAFESITGYPREAAIGLNPMVLKSGQHDNAFYSRLWKTITSGNVWEGRFVNKRRDGSLYTEEASIAPVRSPDGQITGYVAIKRDISEELAREEHLQQSQKMDSIGQLAGGIAHDFNNVLQAIRGFSELLLMKLKKETSEYRHATEIIKAAKRASELTRQLLAFSRKQPVQRARLDLNEVVRETEVLMHVLMGENVHMNFDLSPELKPLFADAGQMSQVLMNLSANARDAMDYKGLLTVKTLNVDILSEDLPDCPGAHPGAYVCLQVSDTGHGMSDEVKDKLFEPFFTTKAVGKGTGLGLAVVYGIVKQNRGWIRVESEEGRGTTFTIGLPADTRTLDQRGESGHKEEMRILLVEDEEDVRAVAVRILTDSGYKVVSSGTVPEAMDLYEQQQGQFDLLFSDIVLGEQNGIDLADRLREKDPELPVLLCSAYSDQKERQGDLKDKGYHFLKKPFTLTSLMVAVRDAMGQHRA